MKKLVVLALSVILLFVFSSSAFAYAPSSSYIDIEFGSYSGLVLRDASTSTVGYNTRGQLFWSGSRTGSATSYQINYLASNLSTTNPVTTPQSRLADLNDTSLRPYNSMFDGNMYTGLYFPAYPDTSNPWQSNLLSYDVNVISPKSNFTSGLGGIYSANAITNIALASSFTQSLKFSFDDGSLVKDMSFKFPFNMQAGVFYNLPVVSFDGLHTLDKVTVNTPEYKSYSTYTPYLTELSLLGSVHVPEPPNPPSSSYSSFISYDVEIKANDIASVIYYEDIVNNFYTKAIQEQVLSYAYYPYSTVLSFVADSYNYVYFFVTDKPVLSDYQINPDGSIVVGDIASQGISGTCFVAYFPVNIQAGSIVTFYAMSAFNNQSPSDVFSRIKSGLPVTQIDGTKMENYSAAGILAAYESSQAHLYTLCSNYSLVNSTYTKNSSIKQAFKFAESWAVLVKLSNASGSEDVPALLNEILAALRKDSSNTVYYKLEQIYDLLYNIAALPDDDPAKQALTDKSANDYIKDNPVPDLAEVIAVTTQISGKIDDFVGALGSLGVIFGAMLVLGVIKVAVQR